MEFIFSFNYFTDYLRQSIQLWILPGELEYFGRVEMVHELWILDFADLIGGIAHLALDNIA